MEAGADKDGNKEEVVGARKAEEESVDMTGQEPRKAAVGGHDGDAGSPGFIEVYGNVGSS